MSLWQEPGTTTKRITVAIILPSGVGSGDFRVRIIESGDVLEMVIYWLKPLTDIHYMHKKWLSDQDSSFSDFHPKFLGFESALRDMREDTYSKVSSTARIGLPFTVQSHIVSISNICFSNDGSNMTYIDLRAIVEEYATLKNTNSFEVV